MQYFIHSLFIHFAVIYWVFNLYTFETHMKLMHFSAVVGLLLKFYVQKHLYSFYRHRIALRPLRKKVTSNTLNTVTWFSSKHYPPSSSAGCFLSRSPWSGSYKGTDIMRNICPEKACYPPPLFSFKKLVLKLPDYQQKD